MAKPKREPPPGKEWRFEEVWFNKLVSISVPVSVTSRMKSGEHTVEQFLADKLIQTLQSILQDVDDLPPIKPTDDDYEFLDYRYGWKPGLFDCVFEASVGRVRRKWKLLKIKSPAAVPFGEEEGR